MKTEPLTIEKIEEFAPHIDYCESAGAEVTASVAFARQLLASAAQTERVRSTAERLIRMTAGLASDKHHPGLDGENHHALAVEVCEAMRELLAEPASK